MSYTFGSLVYRTDEEVCLDSSLVVFIDAKAVSSGAQTLSGFESNNDFAYYKGLRASPQRILRVLYTLLLVSARSHLGVSGGGVAGDSAAPNGFFKNSDGDFVPRVQVYVEAVFSRRVGRDDREILGWRFLFVRNDVAFCFDRALEVAFKMLSRAAMSARRGKRARTEEGVMDMEGVDREGILGPFASRDEWVTKGLTAYAGASFFCSQVANEALAVPLTETENPGRCVKIFTLARAADWLRTTQEGSEISPIYLTWYWITYSATTATQLDAIESKAAEDVERGPGIEEVGDENAAPPNAEAIADGDDDLFQEDEGSPLQADEEGGEENTVVVDARSYADVSSTERSVLHFPLGAYRIDPQKRNPATVFGANCLKFPSESNFLRHVQRHESQEAEEEGGELGYIDGEETRDVEVQQELDTLENAEASNAAVEGAGCRRMDHARKYFSQLRAKCFREVEQAMPPPPAAPDLESIASPVERAKAQRRFEKASTRYRHKLSVRGQRAFFDQLRTSKSTQTIESVLCNDEECPATGIAFDWAMKQMQKHAGAAGDSQVGGERTWSIVRPVRCLVDDSLSLLGNFATRDLLCIEFLEAVLVLHEEVFFVKTTSLLQFDIGKDALRMHVVFSGPPTSGKSFIQELHAQLSIPGLVQSVSVQTNRAMTTSENFNGRQIVIDEIGEQFIGHGTDGTGRADVKEVLSKGKLVTQMCVVEESKRRMVTTVSERKSQHIFGSNPGITKMSAAIASRVAWFQVPMRARPGRSMVEVMYAEEDAAEGFAPHLLEWDVDGPSDEEDDDSGDEGLPQDPLLAAARGGDAATLSAQLRRERCREEWQIRSFVASVIFVWIRTGAVPDIDITLAKTLAVLACDYMRDREGILLDARDLERLVLQCKSICLYDAINRVFFTETHFLEGTPFHLSQILECVQYLSVTHEHFWMAFSQLFPTWSNPHVDWVMQTMYDMIEESSSGADKYAKHFSGDNVSTDYSTYIFRVGARSVGTAAAKGAASVGTRYKTSLTIETACTLIEQRMQASETRGIVLSTENIRDVLCMLSGVMYPTHHWDVNGCVSDSPTIRRAVISEYCGSTYSGLLISREFLENRRARSYEEILVECIRATVDGSLGTSRLLSSDRIVLGCTLRDEKLKAGQEPQPHMLKCLDIRELLPSTQVSVPNPAYRELGFSTIVHGADRARERKEVQRYIPANRLEYRSMRAWLIRSGATTTPERYPPPKFSERGPRQYLFSGLGGQYPENFNREAISNQGSMPHARVSELGELGLEIFRRELAGLPSDDLKEVHTAILESLPEPGEVNGYLARRIAYERAKLQPHVVTSTAVTAATTTTAPPTVALSQLDSDFADESNGPMFY